MVAVEIVEEVMNVGYAMSPHIGISAEEAVHLMEPSATNPKIPVATPNVIGCDVAANGLGVSLVEPDHDLS
jgi:hypothetical protein